MSRKIKIAIIHPSYGITNGGTQVFVEELSNKLKDKFDITIFSGAKVNELCKPVWSIHRRNTSPSLGYKVLNKFISYFSNSPDVVMEHLSSLIPVIYHILRGNYDILFPNNDWGGLLACYIIRLIKGTPIVFTEHCGLLSNGIIAKRNLKFRPDAHISLNDSVKSLVNRQSDEISSIVIQNGIDLCKYNLQESIDLNLPRPIFLCVGRYNPEKRLELAIDAISKLNFGSLIILSVGKNLEKLKKYGEEKIGGDRFIVRSVKYTDMAKYYNSIDIFTLPSENEPFGLVYLEAMACNKPIVTTNDKARECIVGNAGLLCNVECPNAYSQALNDALSTDFQDIPRQQAEKFSLDSVAKRYSDVFVEVFNKSTGSNSV